MSPRQDSPSPWRFPPGPGGQAGPAWGVGDREEVFLGLAAGVGWREHHRNPFQWPACPESEGHLCEWRPSSAPPPPLLRTKSWSTLPVGLQLLSQGIPLSLCLNFSLGPHFAHRLSLSPLSWGPHRSRLLQADPSPTSSLHSPVTLAQPLVADAS